MLVLPGFLVLGLLAGCLLGGRWQRLADLHIRAAWLLVLALGVQILVFTSAVPELSSLPPAVVGAVHVVTLALMIAVALLNFSVSGMRILAVGLALNAVAVFANGGYMPAAPQAVRAIGTPEVIVELARQGRVAKSVLMTDASRLKLLCDVIPLPPPFPRPTVVSLGDLFVGVGAGLIVYRRMRATTARTPARRRVAVVASSSRATGAAQPRLVGASGRTARSGMITKSAKSEGV